MITSEKKYSIGYQALCRFFKEIGFYHEFINYQKDGEKYVDFKCAKIPFDTENVVKSLGKTSITSWMECTKSLRFRYTLHVLFIVWLKEIYNQPSIFDKDYDDMYLRIDGQSIHAIVDYNKKRIKINDIIHKRI